MRTLIFIATIAVANSVGISPATEDLPLRRENGSQQLLILNNGNVVKGHFTRRTGGFDVALNPGRMFIAEGQIRFQASSMEDAYLKMRASIQDLTPNSHIELARWCIANELPSYAKKELLDARFLNPDHETARLMLEGLTREENRHQQKLPGASNDEAAQRLAEQVRMRNILPDRRSLGGLPEPLAVTFTRRVQPLLSNKCGNGRCHGAGRNGFSIVHVRNGSSAAIAEQNLAAVLKQIDADNPDESPLLKVAVGLHGGSQVSLFPGTSGREQLKLLDQWIAGVAAEIGGQPGRATSKAEAAEPIIRTAFAPNDNTSTTLKDGGHLIIPHETPRDRDLAVQQLTTEAVIATRHDEFDPDVFNRRFHGRSASNQPVPRN
jgi:hypothetical protein